MGDLAQTQGMRATLLIIVLLLIVGLVALLWTALRAHARTRAIRRLLDAADALEARLRVARSEIEAVAGDHENPVRQAMQDLLRQRLWLQENAGSARLAQLASMRTALDAARLKIEQQLQRVEQARSQAS